MISIIDFEYDGIRLSDYHYLVCVFDDSGGASTDDPGTTIIFDKTPLSSGKYFSATGARYDECYTTTLQICKDPEWYEKDDMYISNDEYAEIARWLNRRNYLKFTPIESCCMESPSYHYYASFTVSKIKSASRTIGMELIMDTNSPFAFGDPVTFERSFVSSDLTMLVEDFSDEIGYIYPVVEIACSEAGKLEIWNDTLGIECSIDNCSPSEVITMHGKSKIITSSLAAHDLANDFNYNFLKIGNTFQSTSNEIRVNRPCTVSISYEPVLKARL